MIGFSQEGAIARYYYRYGNRSIGLVLIAGFVISLLTTLFLIVIALVLRDLILFYVVVAAFTQLMLSVQSTLRQCQKKAFEYFCISFASALINVFITILLFEIVATKFEYRIVAIIFANTITYIFAFLLYKKNSKIKLRYSTKTLGKGIHLIIGFGVPLFFHQISFFLKGHFDRLFIYHNFSSSDLGIYSAAFQLSAVFSIVLTALNKSLVPYYYEAIKNKTVSEKNITNFFLYSFLLVPVPSLLALLIPEPFFQFILGGEFKDVKPLILIFLLGLSFNIPYLIVVNYFFYKGEGKIISICTITSSILYVFFLIFFSSVDLIAVPFALVLSNILVVLMLFLVFRSYIKKTA